MSSFKNIFSILVNISPSPTYSLFWGIHQGDPLSPFIFIFMVKGRGRNLKAVIGDNLLSGLHPANDDNIASHLQFMDDTLLLIVALMCEVWCLKLFLNAFLEA